MLAVPHQMLAVPLQMVTVPHQMVTVPLQTLAVPLQMLAVPHKMVGLEKMSNYRGIRLERFSGYFLRGITFMAIVVGKGTTKYLLTKLVLL